MLSCQLSGQLALVTGASRGIGQAIALELGKSGAIVVGTATTADARRRLPRWPRTDSKKSQPLPST